MGEGGREGDDGEPKGLVDEEEEERGREGVDGVVAK